MLVVTQHQLESMSDSRQSDFRNRVNAGLVKTFIAAPFHFDEAKIHLRSAAGWQKADSDGMVSETEYVRYLYLAVAVGEDWEKIPELEWLRALFQSNRTGTDKLNLAEAAFSSAQNG